MEFSHLGTTCIGLPTKECLQIPLGSGQDQDKIIFGNVANQEYSQLCTEICILLHIDPQSLIKSITIIQDNLYADYRDLMDRADWMPVFIKYEFLSLRREWDRSGGVALSQGGGLVLPLCINH